MLRWSGLVKPQFISYRNSDPFLCLSNSCNVANFVARNIRIGCVGWRRHSSLIFLILLFTKPNIEVSGWLYQTKTHITHIVYQHFSRVTPPNYVYFLGLAVLLECKLIRAQLMEWHVHVHSSSVHGFKSHLQ